MKNIIIITDSLSDPRIQKRIQLLQHEGIVAKVYGFSRTVNDNKVSFKPIILGNIQNQSYFKRIPILYKGISKVVKQYINDSNHIFYLFGLQVAIVFNYLCNSPYIYEEADLVHTYFRPMILKKWFEKKDKEIIRNSIISFFTSEGFVQYHFPASNFRNYKIVPNKLNKKILELPVKARNRTFNPENIQFGFVGVLRFESTISFIEHLIHNYPMHNFHLYGIVDTSYSHRIETLRKFPNFINHGKFKNPDDLHDIYSSIDFVIATYDIKFDNVRYAEPNKLYESIFFRVPIIVSNGTFLAKQVIKYQSGLIVNALNVEDIDSLLKSINLEKYNSMIDSLNSIDKSMTIDSYKELSDVLIKILS